jgi:hypothetical protein
MSKRPEVFQLQVQTKDNIPVKFCWRGQWYSVSTILMYWLEVGSFKNATPWWQSISAVFADQVYNDVDEQDVTWHIWRIEAKSPKGKLVSDIAFRESLFSANAEPWRMIRVFD